MCVSLCVYTHTDMKKIVITFSILGNNPKISQTQSSDYASVFFHKVVIVQGSPAVRAEMVTNSCSMFVGRSEKQVKMGGSFHLFIRSSEEHGIHLATSYVALVWAGSTPTDQLFAVKKGLTNCLTRSPV